MRELACLYNMSLSQLPAFNWDHSTENSCLLPTLSQGSEIMVSIAYRYGMQAALQSCTLGCTLCFGGETTALTLSMTDPEAPAGVASWWDQSMAWESTLAWKSSSCCFGSCCLCHCARDTSTNKINIWPVT